MEPRRLEDTIRDWGNRYGEEFTDTESSRKIAVCGERIIACRSSGISVGFDGYCLEAGNAISGIFTPGISRCDEDV